MEKIIGLLVFYQTAINLENSKRINAKSKMK